MSALTLLAALAALAAGAEAPCPARLAPYAALLRVATPQGTFEEYELLDRAEAGDRPWRIAHVAVPVDPPPAFDLDRCAVDPVRLTPRWQQFRAGGRSASLGRVEDALELGFGESRQRIAAEGVYGDWSCLVPLLMALPLREGAAFEAPVASPALAAAASPAPPRHRFTVGAARTLAMPWGSERAFPVEQRADGAPALRHWLRARAPHVRLRIEFIDAPPLGASMLALFEPPGVSSAGDCPAPPAR